jgi:hypothetical protein
VHRAVNVDEAATRNDLLDLHAPERGGQTTEEHDFAFGPRRKVSMSALGGRWDVSSIDVMEKRFAQPGSSGDERNVAFAERLAFLEYVKLSAAGPGSHRTSWRFEGHRHAKVRSSAPPYRP